MYNMHAYHRMNQYLRVTVRAGVLRAVCASGRIHMCISCSYVHVWSLVLRIGAHPGAEVPLVVYAYLSSSLHLILAPRTTELVYMYLYMTSAAPTQLQLVVCHMYKEDQYILYIERYTGR